jgi:hypothetical protein
MVQAHDNVVAGALGSGSASVVLDDGTLQHLESASMRVIGHVRSDCTLIRVPPTSKPVTLNCAIAAPGAVPVRVQMAISVHEWEALRAARHNRGVVDLMLEPTVIARYRAQAWIDDRALDMEEASENFDVLPGILQTYPTLAGFLEQAGHGEWDDLACFSSSGQIHQGPFEVEFDHETVLALAALYKGDGRLVGDLIAGDPAAAARVTQEDWDRMRSLVAVLSPTPKHVRADTPESLLFESLAAWEGEEDSVKQEHADLIARMQAVAHRLRPHAVPAPTQEASHSAAPMRMRG